MIRLELSDQDLTEALEDPATNEKNKTKLLVIRMHHEGAKHGFIATSADSLLGYLPMTTDLKSLAVGLLTGKPTVYN